LKPPQAILHCIAATTGANPEKRATSYFSWATATGYLRLLSIVHIYFYNGWLAQAR
jgi:hypothetical protein